MMQRQMKPQGDNAKQGETPLTRLNILMQEQMLIVDVLMKQASLSEYSSLITEIVTHLVSAGGKRVRPLMTLAAANICGIAPQEQINAARLAAAVEYIHNATLLHDDVIDEGKTRHNIPTANRIWGNKPSILVGDYMFSQAFIFMVATGSLEALSLLARTSSIIVESEVLQLQIIGNIDIEEKQYLRLIEAKTASLFAAAMEVGAIAAGADAALRQDLRRFGWLFGMIFQIVDDLLDYFAVHQKFGKAIGGDFYEGKVTCVIMILRQLVNQKERQWLAEVFGHKTRTPQMLDELLALLVKYDVKAKVRAMAEPYIDEGKRIVQRLPAAGGVAAILGELLEYTVSRGY